MTNAALLRHHIAVCDSLGMDTWTTHIDLARSLLRDLEQRDKLLEAAKRKDELIAITKELSRRLPGCKPYDELDRRRQEIELLFSRAIAACEGE